MMWLGLTCVKNSSDSCVWDNGKPITSSSYHNFDIGNPNIQNGPCVYMDVNSGKWRSADCSNVANGYGCKYTPDIDGRGTAVSKPYQLQFPTVILETTLQLVECFVESATGSRMPTP